MVAARVDAPDAAGEVTMALTKDFTATVRARAQSDPAFRGGLLREAIQCLISGDLESGKAGLSDDINATLGFAELGARTQRSPKSLMRMFGPKGNPQARNLLQIIDYLQKTEGVRLEVRCARD